MLGSFFVLAAGLANAQTVQQRVSVPRLYHQNYFYLNPAFAGAEGRREFSLNGHFNSITGKASSAPLTVIGTYHGTAGDTSLNGVGVQMVYDQHGPFWLGKFGLTYAKRFSLGAQSSLAIGTQLSAKYLNVDLAEMDRPEGARRMVGHDNDLRPDIDMGLWLNIRNFYAGASVASLLAPTFNLAENAERQDLREMFVTMGYKINVGHMVSVTPSVMVDRTLASGGKTNVQGGAQANLKFLTGGIIYRGQFDKTAPYNVNAGINIKDNLQLVTSFDITKKDETGVKPDPKVDASLRIRF